MLQFAVIALLGYASAYRVNIDQPCSVEPEIKKPGVVKTPLIPVNSVPDSFDWGNVDGVNYLTNMRN